MEDINIKQKVKELRKFYGQTEPSQLANYLGIELIFSANLRNVLGMYTKINQVPFIFINENLAESVQKLVIAHELGHAILHSDEIKEDLFINDDLSNLGQKVVISYEHEANLFAAFLLINQTELKDLSTQNLSLIEISQALSICPELLIYFFRAARKDARLARDCRVKLPHLYRLINQQQSISFWRNYSSSGNKQPQAEYLPMKKDANSEC